MGDPYHFFRLHRYDGQLLYLKVAASGTYCLIVAVILIRVLENGFPQFNVIRYLLKNFQFTWNYYDDKIYLWLLILSVTDILLAMIWVFMVWVVNIISGLRYKRDIYDSLDEAANARVLRQTVIRGSLDSMLLDAMESNPKKPVLINLSSRKIYVGIINGLEEPTENEGPNSYISFFPLMSGFRDKDTLLIKFTNLYPGEISVKSAPTVKTRKKEIVNDLNIIVRANEVSHISWFDFKMYNVINDSVTKADKKINVRYAYFKGLTKKDDG
jgi:hypothetical protein